MVALAGGDVDGRVAIAENLYQIDVGVFFVGHIDLDLSFSIVLLALPVAADALREVQAFATTVGYIVGSTEIGQVGDEGVVSYFYRIAVRDASGTAFHRIHAVDGNLIVSCLQGLGHFGGLAARSSALAHPLSIAQAEEPNRMENNSFFIVVTS